MKYLKMLGLAAIAAAALMAFAGAGTASATELTCGSSLCAVGTTFHSVSIGKAVLDAPFGNVECESTVHGHVTDPGSPTTTAKVELTEIIWTNCGSDNVVTLAKGTLEIHTEESTPAPNVSANNGTVTSTGAEVTVEHVGTHCIFKTNGTDLGTLTGSANTGGTPKFDISATIPRSGGRSGVFCGSSAPWTGSYTIDAPMTGNVD
ncbi:MAG TPA: hypothetical protein VFX44_10210 [Solirubrobacterales bacterium]|nr:hypothetical protein [Solirubrobacterales bacterium]